jgi:hypothetical protein
MRGLMRQLLTAALLWIPTAATFAGTLTGHVRDQCWFAKYQEQPYGTGYYEYGVNANGAGLTALGGRASTDVFGAFNMPNLAAGSYTVASWGVWWRPAFVFNVPVPGSGSTPDVDVRLRAAMFGYPAFWDDTGWYEFGQTFVATGPVHMIYLRAPFNASYTLSVRQGGPAGARVPGSRDRTFNGGDQRVIYGWGEMPTVAGGNYYVRIRTASPATGGVIMQMDPRPDFSDPMPGGMLHLGNSGGVTAYPDRDLGLVIMCDDDGLLTNLNTRESGGQRLGGTSVGQSFVARGTSLVAASAWLADAAVPAYSVRVLQNGPGGAPVGTTKRGSPARLTADPEMTVTWNPGECPLIPGQSYYLEITKDGGGTFSQVYTNSADPFAFGTAFQNGTAMASLDLAGRIMEEETNGSATMPEVQFAADPAVSEADRGTDALVVRWTTNVPSDSRVEFAAGAPPYTQSVHDPALVTTHAVTLTGLDPHTMIHFRADSSAAGHRAGIFRDQVICTRPAAVNLLANAGFEAGAGVSPRALSGWLATGSLDLKASDGNWFANIPPHSGSSLAQGAVNGAAADGFLYQRVSGTVPGRRYTFSAWVTTWMRENNTFKYDVWQDRGRSSYMRLGIDPAGGTDPGAPSVQWTPRMFSHLRWTNFATNAVAQGNAVTVFVSMKGDGGEWHLYGLDDTVLTTEGPEPLPQPVLAVSDAAANTVRITFGAAVNAGEAANPLNYFITAPNGGSLSVLSAQTVDAFTVVLTTSPQSPGIDYSVEVRNISGPGTPLPSPFSNGFRPVRVPSTLVALDAATLWKYDQSGTDRGTAWRETAFNDGTWSSGPALLAQESAALPEPIRTPLTVGGNRITYYFRHRFNGLPGVTAAPLRIRHIVDDGAAFYLNGQPLHARGVTTPLDYLSMASRTVDNAVFEGPFDLPESALLASGNVFAAEVHQVSAASGDVVFGAVLEALVLPSQLFPRAELNIVPRPGGAQLFWNAPGTILQRTEDMSGPWTDVPGATSPWPVPFGYSQEFFRLRR